MTANLYWLLFIVACMGAYILGLWLGEKASKRATIANAHIIQVQHWPQFCPICAGPTNWKDIVRRPGVPEDFYEFTCTNCRHAVAIGIAHHG